MPNRPFGVLFVCTGNSARSIMAEAIINKIGAEHFRGYQVSATARMGLGQWFAEFVATFGLLLTIFGCAARTPTAIPYAVGLYITSAYWFTASTSFTNPAVTIARSVSDTFAGIAP